MLRRALTKTRKSPRSRGDGNRSLSAGSILEYNEYGLVGFVDDLPLVFCGDNKSRLSLREVLRASAGVMGESRLGKTEKMVLLEGKVYAVKRFRKVGAGKSEFKKRVEMLARVSKNCQDLVSVNACLYAKRIEFVLCHYCPMGSLTDLLAGGSEYAHTVLDWNQRQTIALSIARAIAFIHTQLAELEEVSDTWQRKPPPTQQITRSHNLCRESDKALLSMKYLIQRIEQIRDDTIEFFEF